ncbi:MAG TPA: beta-ketoacyl synthase N-terminal-like domain-containing protein, partial [Steroidobacter sp.]|nr:beta-ketoacyl synthase N-terminal-like domain-containing protein [Steroidobacter sp.]
MTNKALVAGVGMIPFTKPGKSQSYDVMGAQAARFALQDAGIAYEDVGQAYVGYVFGDSTCGQSALYEVGLTGVPVVNVNNNCSTGSTALYLARQAVESGVVDVALALGFEQMNPGALTVANADRPPILGRFWKAVGQLQQPDPNAPFAAQWFGGAGREHQEKYGTKQETFARISQKARKHAANNPLAVFRDPLTLEEVMQSQHLYGPLTRYQACPPTCGAAAAVIVSPAYAKRKGLQGLVKIAGQALATDKPASFGSMLQLVGSEMTKTAAAQAYAHAGIGPKDVQVVELHDCFSVAEAVFSEALGLCPEGGAEKMVLDGDNTYGG